MGRTKIPITLYQREVLQKNYLKVTFSRLSKMSGLSEITVRRKLKEMGIYKCQWPEKRKEYKSDKPLTSIPFKRTFIEDNLFNLCPITGFLK